MSPSNTCSCPKTPLKLRLDSSLSHPTVTVHAPLVCVLYPAEYLTSTMSTSDKDPAPFHPTDPDATTSTDSGRILTTPTTSYVLSQTGPDTIVKNGISSYSLPTADLNKARVILREHISHLINLSMD